MLFSLMYTTTLWDLIDLPLPSRSDSKLICFYEHCTHSDSSLLDSCEMFFLCHTFTLYLLEQLFKCDSLIPSGRQTPWVCTVSYFFVSPVDSSSQWICWLLVCHSDISSILTIFSPVDGWKANFLDLNFNVNKIAVHFPLIKPVSSISIS